MMALKYPAGTQMQWTLAGGGGVAKARTEIVKFALDAGACWVWFIDDDHTFSPNTLHRLLDHDRDIVTPFVLFRKYPYSPIIYAPFEIPENASDVEMITAYALDRQRPDIPAGFRGLLEVGHGGTGGMLISSEVLRALEAPHFEFGRLGVEGGGEDTWFCLRARRAGFKVWCDIGTPIGHLTTVAVWPRFDEAGEFLGPDLEWDYRQALAEKRLEPRSLDPAFRR